MSKLIPPPPPTVPLGFVKDGRVIISQDWALYLTVGILQRIGGYNAPDIGTLIQKISQSFSSMEDGGGEDVVFVPGPAGPQGPAGQAALMMWSEDAGQEALPIPGPQGPQGVAGVAGVMAAWEFDAPTEPIFPPGNPPGWGRYTPTLTNVANLDASTSYEWRYIQVGPIVFASGKIDVNPTAAGLVQLGISLPVPSTFTNASHCTGVAASPGVAGQSAAIVGDTANNRAEMEFIAVDLNNRAMYCNFMYQVA